MFPTAIFTRSCFIQASKSDSPRVAKMIELTGFRITESAAFGDPFLSVPRKPSR